MDTLFQLLCFHILPFLHCLSPFLHFYLLSSLPFPSASILVYFIFTYSAYSYKCVNKNIILSYCLVLFLCFPFFCFPFPLLPYPIFSPFLFLHFLSFHPSFPFSSLLPSFHAIPHLPHLPFFLNPRSAPFLAPSNFLPWKGWRLTWACCQFCSSSGDA